MARPAPPTATPSPLSGSTDSGGVCNTVAGIRGAADARGAPVPPRPTAVQRDAGAVGDPSPRGRARAQHVGDGGRGRSRRGCEIAALGARGPEYEAIARLSREIIEQIVWEVVPELAEVIIREHVERHVRA